MTRFLRSICVFSLLCSPLLAQSGNSSPQASNVVVPRLIRFAGTVARHTDSGLVGVTFALYKTQSDASPIWTETQNVQLDAAGKYSILLGATKTDGIPMELFTSGEAQWLGVRVEGQREQARILLVSVPYALKAAEADTLAGKPLSAFVLNGESTGKSGDGLTYLNTSEKQSPAAITSASSGTAGYIGKFTNSTDLGNSVVYQSGSKIGVNNLSPSGTLHVVATASTAAYLDSYSGGATAPATPLFMRSARGTASAATALQGNDMLGGFLAGGSDGSGTLTTTRGGLVIRAGGAWSTSATPTYIQFFTTAVGSTASTEAMRLNPAGNLGIGTTTPTAKLEVNGTAKFNGVVTFAASQTFPGAIPPGFSLLGSSPAAPAGFSSNGWLTVNGQPWTSGANLNAGRRTAAAAVIGGAMYVVGGCGDVGCRTPIANLETSLGAAWTTLSPEGFTPRWGASAAPSAAAIATGAMYVFGGSTDNGTTISAINEMYDPAANTWSSRASMPVAQIFGCTVADPSTGYIYILGGYTSSGTNAVPYRYDPVNNSYLSLTAEPIPASSQACAFFNNKIYAFGGGTGTSNTQIYDIASNTWSSGAAMPYSTYGSVATVLGAQIYITGGYSGTHLSALGIYDPASNAWKTGPNSPLDPWQGNAIALNGHIYLVAGETSASEQNALTSVYNPANVQFLYTKN